jgi:hypothetical protein
MNGLDVGMNFNTRMPAAHTHPICFRRCCASSAANSCFSGVVMAKAVVLLVLVLPSSLCCCCCCCSNTSAKFWSTVLCARCMCVCVCLIDKGLSHHHTAHDAPM